MKRISIDTTTSISTNTKTTNLEPYLTSSLKKRKSYFSSLKKINSNNIKSFSDFSSEQNIEKSSSEFLSSKESKISNDKSKSTIKNSLKKEASFKYNIIKHKKISNLPYNLKDNEDLKLQYINQNLKNTKFPKYYSDYIGLKLKKDINFPNMDIFSKKSKRNSSKNKRLSFLLSEQKIFNQKYIFLNSDNKYISFGLYYDKDIIENSKELNKELIENDLDMDNESDDENISSGYNMCLYDLKKGFHEFEKNPKSLTYIKKNKIKY